MAETLLTPLIDDLRACLCSTLQTAGVETCFCGLYPGASVAADFCSCNGGGSCGMAWVRLSSVFPSSKAFPLPDNGAADCGTVLAAVLEVGIYRCRPVPDSQGNMDPAALASAALTQAADAIYMHRAIACCDPIRRRPHALGTYLPAADSGGCGGGTWPVTVQLIRL